MELCLTARSFFSLHRNDDSYTRPKQTTKSFGIQASPTPVSNGTKGVTEKCVVLTRLGPPPPPEETLEAGMLCRPWAIHYSRGGQCLEASLCGDKVPGWDITLHPVSTAILGAAS